MLRSGARGWAPLRAPLGGAPERCPGPEGTPCRCSGAVPGAGHRSGVPRSGALGRRAPPAGAPERCPGLGTARGCAAPDGAVPWARRGHHIPDGSEDKGVKGTFLVSGGNIPGGPGISPACPRGHYHGLAALKVRERVSRVP